MFAGLLVQSFHVCRQTTGQRYLSQARILEAIRQAAMSNDLTRGALGWLGLAWVCICQQPSGVLMAYLTKSYSIVK